MNESQHKDPFLQQVKSTLDQSADELDDATLRELRRARYAAVEASHKRSSWLLPLGGLATAATVAAFSVSLWMASPPPGVDESLPPLDDLALLGDAESLEFYEDLDFYLWLEDEKGAG
jgi:Protein of unknown function (DUF3619)